MNDCVRTAHPIEFELHIIIFMLRKFPQFLRNQPNNNDDDEQLKKKHRFILFSWRKNEREKDNKHSGKNYSGRSSVTRNVTT